MEYEFTNEWFVPYTCIWRELFETVKPSSVLEIGSYEGRSTAFMIELIGSSKRGEVHCIDTWKGSVEHAKENMRVVEQRFDSNMKTAITRAANPVQLHKHKGSSLEILPLLLTQGFKNYFDLIYIDGSHQAPDVLFDAVNSFQLLRNNGVMIFDDYLWQMEEEGRQDHYNLPKPAIDAFFNIYRRKLQLITAPLYQLYVLKTGD